MFRVFRNGKPVANITYESGTKVSTLLHCVETNISKDPVEVLLNGKSVDASDISNTRVNEGDNIVFHLKPVEKPIRTQCIKVAALRKSYGSEMNLREWLKDEENLYVGRRGRIFIDKEIFHYPGSIWGNPFKVGEYSLEESLRLYEEHVRENLMEELPKLKGKVLGCFCDQKNPCHAKVLKKLAEE